jgi:cytidylate kinase
MNFGIPPERLIEGLARAHQHWQLRHGTLTTRRPGPPAFTIALSREAGTYAAAIARAVGDRLGWPVYDRELLQRIADDMGVRQALLESVDERQVGWLSECLQGLSSGPVVSQSAYVRHLVETLLALATHGNAVIVGRGATKVLPPATTLRVRVVAPLEQRIEAVRREHGISKEEAARRVEATDRERSRFVQAHFLTDPADPRNYDLVLNAARFSPGECADLIIAALDRLRGHGTTGPAPHRVGAMAGV